MFTSGILLSTRHAHSSRYAPDDHYCVGIPRIAVNCRPLTEILESNLTLYSCSHTLRAESSLSQRVEVALSKPHALRALPSFILTTFLLEHLISYSTASVED